MISTKQNVFLVFATGFFLLGLSVLMVSTPYFLHLFMLGVWTIILSGALFKIHGVRVRTPRLHVGAKEQFVSDLKSLL